VGPGDVGSAWVTASAVLGSALAAVIATGFRLGHLGPDSTDEPAQPGLAIARGLRDGLTAAKRAPSVASGLVALAAHRLSFGIATLVTLLLYRYSFSSDGLLRAGLAGIGQVIAAGAAGMLLAALLTPLLITRFGRGPTVRAALLTAAVVIVGLGLPMRMSTMLAASFALAAAGQVVKLSLDAAVQGDVGDQARGRVFALYDTVFNIGFVLAVALAAVVIPPDGRSPELLLVAAGGYLAAALLHRLIDRSPILAPRRADLPEDGS
jgi:MFS family permease